MKPAPPTLFVLVLLLAVACQKEVDQPPPPPCSGSETEHLVGDWKLSAWGATAVSENTCLDTTCLRFKLRFTADSTYVMDYQLFFPFGDTLTQVYTRTEQGTFAFECHSRYVYETRFTYYGFKGRLHFFPEGGSPYAWDIAWDDFWYLQIDLPLDENSPLLTRLFLGPDD
jgi:hypothetical protein